MIVYGKDRIITATVHDFKTNISRFIRLLENETYDVVILRRHKKTVGYVIPPNRPLRLKKSAKTGPTPGADAASDSL